MASGIEQLERYELCERIATGGMAEVYLAKAYGAHGFEKTLAVKRILPELASDLEFEERFIAEAKLAVQLSHANIVQVFDFGRVGRTLFLVLEYVDGLDLAALLGRYRNAGRELPLPAAFQIAIEMARGLDFAHRRRVIHRDVSPSNILLSKAGDVKVADFGIAVPDAEHIQQASRRQRIMGKWRYMSPEQTRGDDLDTRSDLFALGAIIFELVTGDKLFSATESDHIVEQIHEMDIPDPATRRSGVPARLHEVLCRALARDRNQRFDHASDLQRVLAQLCHESNIIFSALEVADAVHAVLRPEEREDLHSGPRPVPLDGLIRQHLGVASDVGAQRRTSAGSWSREATITGAGDEDDAASERADGAEADGSDTALTVPVGAGAHKLRTRAASDTQRPPTIVKTGAERDGVSIWDYGEDGGDSGGGGGNDRDSGGEENARAQRASSSSSSGSGAGAGEGVVGEGGEHASTERLMGESARAGATPPAAAASKRGRWALGAGGAALLFAAVLSYGGLRGELGQSVEIADAGAASAPPRDAEALQSGILFINSRPEGAEVLIDGVLQEARTPNVYQVAAREPHRVELRLGGHAGEIREGVVVGAGGTAPLRFSLEAMRRPVLVDSEPRGAKVLLDGRRLGETPLAIELSEAEIERIRAGALVLEKAGYRAEQVELSEGELHAEDGASVHIARALRRLRADSSAAAPAVGTVRIHLEGTWANVYLGAEQIGRVPGELELPVGAHTLRLENPVSQRSWRLQVRARAGEPSYYRVPD
ncbi:serine/threonine-protein kinase [Haliangium ochraceum]|uniref:Serine/threonine protein kinase n=1 Tax=Haliangium ochraceum (strain DSM 14365 / JCM 11303 / SMP-2) TaxID=502025 RepID=D0LM29_HALO1|nr:serine/threonine-protein kinase [Haliangium ochraceum]ACY15207.1 serine/threonine protein kinase [Haliangium ochraceum DSM 14365]